MTLGYRCSDENASCGIFSNVHRVPERLFHQTKANEKERSKESHTVNKPFFCTCKTRMVAMLMSREDQTEGLIIVTDYSNGFLKRKRKDKSQAVFTLLLTLN